MSESDVVSRWLGHAANRIRRNQWLEDLSRLLIGLSALVIVYQCLRVMIRVPVVTAALLPLFVLSGVFLIGFFAWRLMRRYLLLSPDRARAAALVDARAGLNNELGSAWWFISSAPSGDFVKLHLTRAARTIQGLELSRLLPLVLPRSFSAGLALLMVAALAIWLQPRFGVMRDEIVMAHSSTQRAAGTVAVPEIASEDDFRPDETAAGPSEVAWLKIENLAREMRAGPDTAEIAEAIAARDAHKASRMLAGMQRRQAAQPASGRSAARPQTEQMSKELAKGIVDRLQSLLSEGGGWPGQAEAGNSGKSAERLTDQLTRQLREEMDDAQTALPGEMSPEEQALNTTLQAMSRDSTGGREAIRGEANPMQGLGRTSVGSGAMGRRINVSTGGAGDGEQPQGNPQGEAEAEPVLGKKTLRLQLQTQTVTIDSPDSDDSEGAEESFYAATQAQAARTRYEDVVAEQHTGAEHSSGAEQLPLAYRDSVKEYTARQHRRERATGK